MAGLRICGKTGTAQVKNEHGQETGRNNWFASFAPYENPKYAVVVMVQSDGTVPAAAFARRLRTTFTRRF